MVTVLVTVVRIVVHVVEIVVHVRLIQEVLTHIAMTIMPVITIIGWKMELVIIHAVNKIIIEKVEPVSVILLPVAR